MGREPKEWVPLEYQDTSLRFLFERTVMQGAEGGAALLLDPGMGKTAISLAFFKFLKMCGYARKALVVAPRRVCSKVWPKELYDWTNFHDLSMSLVRGNESARRRKLAVPADIYVISRDNVSWLSQQLKRNKHEAPWDIVFFDESTSYKTWSSNRSQGARYVAARIPYRVILTGTPAPKDLGDLFPQIFLLDQGASLGKDVTAFRNQYCMGEGEREYGKFIVRSDMEDAIRAKIAPMCLRLNIRDYVSMPEIIYNDVMIDLPREARQMYDLMEEMLFLSLEGAHRDISNAAALYGACKQIANGGIYDNERKMHHLHNEKIDAAEDLIDELSGKPALIAYQFEHDAERIAKRFKHIKIIRGGMKEAEFNRVIDAWNDGTLSPCHLAVQPQAMSYGINMQHGEGRDVVWLGLSDSLETYQQLNARLWRMGVGSTVRIHRILAEDTVDMMNCARIDQRFDVQERLLEALEGYAKEKTGQRVLPVSEEVPF